MACPSSTIASASRISAIWSRLDTKPARSPTSAGRLPTARRKASTRSTVPRAVSGPAMTSMPGVHSGGLNQCTPRNRCGSATAAASPAIGSEEVLVAMTAAAGAAAEQRPRTSALSSGSSGTASTTRSAPATAASRSGGVVTRSVRSTASSGSSPAATWPRVRSSSRSRACSASSGEASTSATRSPARARWPAMPPPIVPPPSTAMDLNAPSSMRVCYPAGRRSERLVGQCAWS